MNNNKKKKRKTIKIYIFLKEQNDLSDHGGTGLFMLSLSLPSELTVELGSDKLRITTLSKKMFLLFHATYSLH